MAEPFDVHAHREQLKLLTDTGATKLFENRGMACPVCGKSFTRLFLTTEDGHSFPGGDPFCVRNGPEQVVIFTHE
jgi:hypothetical protein